MAEKEERILCIETDEKIVECGYGDFYNTMTRQKAIEKMAKAIFTLRFAPLEIKGKGWDDLNGWQKGNCLRIAEAALNALLEGK